MLLARALTALAGDRRDPVLLLDVLAGMLGFDLAVGAAFDEGFQRYQHPPARLSVGELLELCRRKPFEDPDWKPPGEALIRERVA